ncbi:MAG: HD domain-containing protein [Erysipelotrichaceae bacterium]|nr:HD domain-containing protein [Erysipelotrichaceae bacterium]
MIKEITQEGRHVFKALITKADQGRTNKNVPYLSLLLSDSSDVMDAKFWNLTEEQAAYFKAGMVVQVKGDLIYHRNARQMRVLSMSVLEDELPADYVRQAVMPRKEMEQEIFRMVEEMENPVIRSLAGSLLKDNLLDFLTYPAAVKNHHNYVGGLAWHTISMARLADSVVNLYPFLNRDLLMAGILLHDLGKTIELSSPVLPEYTANGNLIGHISLMTSLLDREAVRQGVQDSEEAMLLKHLILSHHGKMEYGSPVLPMIPEAEVLTILDNLDARMVMMKDSVDQTLPGMFGPRVFALDNRMIYRRKDYVDPDGQED